MTSCPGLSRGIHVFLERRWRGPSRRSLRRAVLARAGPARRLRPAPGKGLQFRGARRAAAALRHRGDARPPRRRDRTARPAHGDRARRQFSRPRRASTAIRDRSRRPGCDAGAARLDLDFGQSRSRPAVRSRRRGGAGSGDRPDRVPARADRRRRRDIRPSASEGAGVDPRPLDGAALFCLRRRARGHAGVRRLSPAASTSATRRSPEFSRR